MTDNPNTLQDPATQFSAERTLLSWIRTGLSMMGFGFVVARFGLFLRQMEAVEAKVPVSSHSLSLWIGVALVALGVVVNLVSAWQHWQITHRIQRGETLQFSSLTLGTFVSVVLALMGASLIGYLVFELQSSSLPNGQNQPNHLKNKLLQQIVPDFESSASVPETGIRQEISGRVEFENRS